MTPLVPEWFLRDLKLIDPLLQLEWDPKREAFWLQSVRGTDRLRQEVAPYGVFEVGELNQVLLDSIRIGIRRRDDGVKIKDILKERQALRDLAEDARWRKVREAGEDQAMREVEAANTSSKIYSQGDAGYRHGNRHEGMIPKELRR